jgi:hypothetical protein
LRSRFILKPSGNQDDRREPTTRSRRTKVGSETQSREGVSGWGPLAVPSADLPAHDPSGHGDDVDSRADEEVAAPAAGGSDHLDCDCYQSGLHSHPVGHLASVVTAILTVIVTDGAIESHLCLRSRFGHRRPTGQKTRN